MLAHPQLRWRFRQNYEHWQKLVNELRDPGSTFEKEFSSFSMTDRENLADAIDAALRGVDEDGEAGTA